jgi:SAM-dependent MidA family methyltransferase
MDIDEAKMIEHIKSEIHKEPTATISYSQFMELALYHPELGYYMKDKSKIGKLGDFYTSSSISPVFAEIIASVFIKLIENKMVPPIIIEFGAGNGLFAKHVLQTWREKSPDTFEIGHYYIVETSPYHKKLILEAVSNYEQVIITDSLEDIQTLYPSYNGIIFSNEFFDAFPVDIIENKNGKLMEVRIGEDEESKLIEKVVPLQKEWIADFLKEYSINVKDGYRYEIPIPMCSFIRHLGEWVQEGIVFTVDYGYTDEEWDLPFHKEGSLRGYFQHQLIKNPLEHVGEMDLTTHIHFDKLIKAGQESGLDFYEKYRQDEFLMKAGIINYLQEHSDPNPFSEKSKKNRAIRSLLIQGGISSHFHVLIQTKNMNQLQLKEMM